MNWTEKIKQVWRAKEIRKSLVFVLLMLVVFRLGAHIPIPGIDVGNLREFFNQNELP